MLLRGDTEDIRKIERQTNGSLPQCAGYSCARAYSGRRTWSHLSALQFLSMSARPSSSTFRPSCFSLFKDIIAVPLIAGSLGNARLIDKKKIEVWKTLATVGPVAES